VNISELDLKVLSERWFKSMSS